MSSSAEAPQAVDAAGLPFETSARCYDLLNRDKDYAAEAAYVTRLIRQRAPTSQRILELGCGTGAHAEHLAGAGFTVHGVDLSRPMLDRALERQAAMPAALGQRLSFEAGDVRAVRTGRTYDVVLSLFHVMSYQTEAEDLAAAYDTAWSHLAPGGLFVFDHWYGPAVLTQRPSVRVRRLQDEHLHVTRLAEPTLHWQRNVCDVHFSYLVCSMADGVLHRFEETHPMRYFFEPELRLVEGARWTSPESLAWMSDRTPSADDWAAVRVLVKGPGAAD